VLNGDGVQGQAASLAQWLRQAGMQVTFVGSAPSYSYAQTEIVVGDPRAQASAQTVATLLQTPIVRGRNSGGAPVVVIIGRDFQDPTQQ
jgi:hypothetical protein